MKPMMQKRLDAALRHFGLKDQTASKRAKLDEDFIRNMRRGKSESPRTENFQKLAASFQTSAAWLGGEPEAEPPVWARSDDPEAGPERDHDDGADGGNASMRVTELDVRGSMGPGLEVQGETQKGEWQFPRDFLRQATSAPADRLRMITVVGDSCEPALRSMERVLVDTQDLTPSPAGFFVVWDGLGQVVKRVEYIAHSSPPRVRISSVNPAYEAYERNLDEAYVQGRVLGRWQWV